MRDHGDVGDMQDLINLCEDRFDGEQLRFKVHPRDDSSYTSKHPRIREGGFIDMAVNAEQVVGLNSTCLLEAVLLGAPTEALGDGFLRAHAGREERPLAAILGANDDGEREALHGMSGSFSTSAASRERAPLGAGASSNETRARR